MSRTDPRLHVPFSVPFLEGMQIALSPDQARYLGAVLRQEVGACVRVFNATDGEWLGRIATLRRDRATVSLQRREREPAPPAPLDLLFAPLKRDATDLVIRMGTELGVTRFRPVVTERTNTHRLNPERLSLIAAEAAEQCERLDVPRIMPLVPLREALAAWPEDAPFLAALERSGVSEAGEGAAALLVGPEGGFSEGETRLLRAHPAARPVSLGPLVLRAETACCAGLALIGAGRRGEA